MDRVIFCPDESFLAEAERLSRLHVAPILIGDNERTSRLLFDREKPIPLSIPVDHYLLMEPQRAIIGQFVTFQYVNEFLNFNDGVFFTLFSHSVGEPNGHVVLSPNRLDRHFAEFIIRMHVETKLSLVVWKDDEQYLWLNEFYFYPKDAE